MSPLHRPHIRSCPNTTHPGSRAAILACHDHTVSQPLTHSSSQYTEERQGNRNIPRHGLIIASSRRALLSRQRHGYADVRLVVVSYDDIREDANAASEVVRDCDSGREIEIRICGVVTGIDLASDVSVWAGEGRREGSLEERGRADGRRERRTRSTRPMIARIGRELLNVVRAVF